MSVRESQTSSLQGHVSHLHGTGSGSWWVNEWMELVSAGNRRNDQKDREEEKDKGKRHTYSGSEDLAREAMPWHTERALTCARGGV